MKTFKLFRGYQMDAVGVVTNIFNELSAPPPYQIPIERYDDRISLDVIDFVTNHRQDVTYDNQIARFVIYDETYENDILRRCKVMVHPYSQSDFIRLDYTVNINIAFGRFYPQIISKTMSGL